MDGFRLGLDYGTSNTVAVLRWPDGKTRPLIVDGSPLMPSAVYAEADGSLIVGRDAERGARLDPARLERNPKRRIDEGEVLLGGEGYPVVNLISGTIRRVVDEAVRTAGGPLSQAVLTCPAAWGPVRRRVLLDAAALGGLVLPSLLPEPVAAATYFATVLGRHVPVGASVVVYDLGAGTFDASVVRRTDAGFETLACQGIDNFGGLDLDALLAAHIGRTIGAVDPHAWHRLTSPADASDRRHFSAFWEDVRLTKEALSRHPTASLHVPLIDRDAFVTRDEFEQLAQPGLAGTVEVTLSTIHEARVRPADLAGVFLVGGSTRIPLVGTLLHRAIGVAPAVLEQPELVVAEGALLALQPRHAHGAARVMPPAHAPVSAVPMSPAPVSAAPVSPGPVSAAPASPGPVSAVPVSPAPMSPAPIPPAPMPPPPMPTNPMRTPMRTPMPMPAAPTSPARVPMAMPVPPVADGPTAPVAAPVPASRDVPAGERRGVSRRTLLIGLGAGAAVAAGTAGVILWPRGAGRDVGGSPSTGASSASPSPSPSALPAGTPVWHYQTAKEVECTPTVAGNLVYFGGWDGNVYALNAAKGELDWKFQTGALIYSGPTVADGVLYIGSHDRHLYALGATDGTLTWSFPTGDAVFSSPRVSGGIVYFGCNDTYVYAVDTSGRQVWRFKTGGFVGPSPTIVNGIVYVGSYDRQLYALEAATGKLLWSYEGGSGFHSSPAVVDNIVYTGNGDGYVHALDARTGAKVWAYQVGTEVASSPAVTGGTVYVGSHDHLFYALDARSGALRWKFTTGDKVLSSPVVKDGVVYFGSGDSNVYALRAADGVLRWRYPTGKSVLGSPTVAGAILYIGSWDGSLYALSTG